MGFKQSDSGKIVPVGDGERKDSVAKAQHDKSASSSSGKGKECA
jgi:hypothetical protein